MSLEQLLEIAPPPILPPVDAGTPQQWTQVEAALGTELPTDYKALVNAYGAGWFGNYLTVYDPFHPAHRYPSVLSVFKKSYDERLLVLAEREIVYDYERRFLFSPDANGLLPWGKDDNNGLFCWLTVGAPDTWQTIVLSDDWDIFVQYPQTAVAFLVSWLTGRVDPDFYPPEVYPFHAPLFRHEIDYDLYEVNGLAIGSIVPPHPPDRAE